MKKIGRKGFTLVELLAVVVILITIMAIAVPVISSSISRNKEKQNVQRIKMLESAAMEYANDEINNGTFTCVDLNTLLDKGYISKEESQDADGNNFKGYIKYEGNEYKYVTSGNCDNTSDNTNDDNNSGNTNDDNNSGANVVYISQKLKLGDYISMTPNNTSFKTNTSKTGFTSAQTIDPRELNIWRVIKIDKDSGTVDVISDKVSNTNVYFKGLTGYKNYVGYLNELASKYTNSTYTSGSRYFGYYKGTASDPGQTEFINDESKFTTTAPWTCSTGEEGCNPVESQGGGDTKYENDSNLVNAVYGNLIAYKAGTTEAAKYMVASRLYIKYRTSDAHYWQARYVDTSGNFFGGYLYYYNNGSLKSSSGGQGSLRPIVTLKANLKIKDDGNDGKSESTAYNLEAS